MDVLSLSLAIVALIFGIAGSVFGAISYLEVKAYKLSTHKIEYVPFNSTPHSEDVTTSEQIQQYNKAVIDDLVEEDLNNLF